MEKLIAAWEQAKGFLLWGVFRFGSSKPAFANNKCNQESRFLR